jgi:hypothetical protein
MPLKGDNAQLFQKGEFEIVHTDAGAHTQRNRQCELLISSDLVGDQMRAVAL